MNRTKYYDVQESASILSNMHVIATILAKLSRATRREYLQDVFWTLCQKGEDKEAFTYLKLVEISIDDIFILPILNNRGMDEGDFYIEKSDPKTQTAGKKANTVFVAFVRELYKKLVEDKDISNPLIETRKHMLDTLVNHIKANQGGTDAADDFTFIVRYCFGSDAQENFEYLTRLDLGNRNGMEKDLNDLFSNTFKKATEGANDKELINWYQRVESLNKSATYKDVLKMLSIALMRYYHREPALSYIEGYAGISRELRIIELVRGCSPALFESVVDLLEPITFHDIRLLYLKKLLEERLAVSGSGEPREFNVEIQYRNDLEEITLLVTEIEHPAYPISVERALEVGKQHLNEVQHLISKFKSELPLHSLQLTFRIIHKNDQREIYSHTEYLPGVSDVTK